VLSCAALNCNKALIASQRESESMCGGSPLIADYQKCMLRSILNVGEITQERRLKYYSRSPLSEPELVTEFSGLLFVIHVGEIHRRGVVYLYSRSPLFVFLFFHLVYNCLHVGEIHRRGDVVIILVLPL